MIFDKIIQVSRLQADNDNADKEGYVSDLSLQNVQVNIQPASPEYTVITEGQFAKTFKAFVTRSGILDGDRVTVSGTSDTYTVKGVEDWNFPPLPHYELILHKAK